MVSLLFYKNSIHQHVKISWHEIPCFISFSEMTFAYTTKDINIVLDLLLSFSQLEMPYFTEFWKMTFAYTAKIYRSIMKYGKICTANEKHKIIVAMAYYFTTVTTLTVFLTKIKTNSSLDNDIFIFKIVTCIFSFPLNL